MAERNPFVVDISSADAIANGFEQVLQELEAARGRLVDAREDVRHWEAIYDRLKLLASEEDSEQGPSIRASAVKIVNEREKATRADDVIAALGGSVERKSVNWALWDAARSGEIKKIATGIYVPLDYAGTTTDAVLQTALDQHQAFIKGVEELRGAPSSGDGKAQ